MERHFGPHRWKVKKRQTENIYGYVTALKLGVERLVTTVADPSAKHDP